MISYAMVLLADENRMSANTLQADNTVRGQWGMVDDYFRYLKYGVFLHTNCK